MLICTPNDPNLHLELLEVAVQQKSAFAQSATTSKERIGHYLARMSQKLIAEDTQAFLLFWYERREYYWKLFHIRFFGYQVKVLPYKKIVLSTQEYSKETGDEFNNAVYANSLPSIKDDILKGFASVLEMDDRAFLKSIQAHATFEPGIH
jgi:hypothetical protein